VSLTLRSGSSVSQKHPGKSCTSVCGHLLSGVRTVDATNDHDELVVTGRADRATPPPKQCEHLASIPPHGKSPCWNASLFAFFFSCRFDLTLLAVAIFCCHYAGSCELCLPLFAAGMI
jgi:hypothetical protein